VCCCCFFPAWYKLFFFFFLYHLNNSIAKIGLEQEGTLSSYTSTNNQINRIEKLDNNRTIIHVGEPSSLQQCTDTKSVSDIINRFNTLNINIWDGQYSFTNDIPPKLMYHLRLPLETLMDTIRIQSDPELNLLKIFMDQQERSLLVEEEKQQNDKFIIRATSRLCRLPRDYRYDYNHLHVHFLKDNFIRIEIPTLN
jgi:hypothetical protein